MYNSAFPASNNCANHGSAEKLMQGEGEKNRLQRPHNLVLLILFSGAKVPLFSFSKKRKKLEKGKYQKHWPHLRHPYPCLGIVLIPLFLFLETKVKGKLAEKKKANGELAQMIRVLL